MPCWKCAAGTLGGPSEAEQALSKRWAPLSKGLCKSEIIGPKSDRRAPKAGEVQHRNKLSPAIRILARLTTPQFFGLMTITVETELSLWKFGLRRSGTDSAKNESKGIENDHPDGFIDCSSPIHIQYDEAPSSAISVSERSRPRNESGLSGATSPKASESNRSTFKTSRCSSPGLCLELQLRHITLRPLISPPTTTIASLRLIHQFSPPSPRRLPPIPPRFLPPTSASAPV